MPKFLIQYKHVEETTYKEWVEAATEEEAIQKAEEDPNFDTVVAVQGIRMKDFKVMQQED